MGRGASGTVRLDAEQGAPESLTGSSAPRVRTNAQVWLGRCKGSQEQVALKLLDLDSLNCDLVRLELLSCRGCRAWCS